MKPLTWKQKLLLRLNGRCFLRYEKRPGWSDYLAIYAAKCKLHGLFEDYCHGWQESLWCPICGDVASSKSGFEVGNEVLVSGLEDSES